MVIDFTNKHTIKQKMTLLKQIPTSISKGVNCLIKEEQHMRFMTEKFSLHSIVAECS